MESNINSLCIVVVPDNISKRLVFSIHFTFSFLFSCTWDVGHSKYFLPLAWKHEHARPYKCIIVVLLLDCGFFKTIIFKLNKTSFG